MQDARCEYSQCIFKENLVYNKCYVFLYMTFKNKTIDLVTIGNSLTQGHPPPHNNHPGKYQYTLLKVTEKAGYSVVCRNYGIGGQEAEQIAIRVPNALPCDIISILAGTNDCWRYSTYSDDLAADMRDYVLKQLKRAVNYAKNGPNGEEIIVILCSIPPTRPGNGSSSGTLESIKKLRPRIKKLCAEEGIHFCDVYKAMADIDGQAKKNLVMQDGVHFTDDGNAACGEAIGQKIVQILDGRS